MFLQRLQIIVKIQVNFLFFSGNYSSPTQTVGMERGNEEGVESQWELPQQTKSACVKISRFVSLWKQMSMSPYSEISLVSRRFFGRDDGQTSRISPSLLCLPVLCAFPNLLFQRFTPKFPGHRGSPTLSIFHMIQGVATKTKKRAIIAFCDASGAACTG